MKTREIQGKQTILLVDLGDKNKFAGIVGDSLYYEFEKFVQGDYPMSIPILQGNWKFISTIEAITEEQADGLVEKCIPHSINTWPDYGWKATRYKACNYVGSAIESFQSLLKANDVMLENECGFMPKPNHYSADDDSHKFYPADLAEWQEAEAKVFSPSTTLIFVKDS